MAKRRKAKPVKRERTETVGFCPVCGDPCDVVEVRALGGDNKPFVLEETIVKCAATPECPGF